MKLFNYINRIMGVIVLVGLIVFYNTAQAVVKENDIPTNCNCLSLSETGLTKQDLYQDAWFNYVQSKYKLAPLVESIQLLEESLQIDVMKYIYFHETNKHRKRVLRKFIDSYYKLNW